MQKTRPAYFEHTIAFAVLALFFWHYLIPIWDIDFWWHITSGRWIFENSAFPSSDPFAVFSNSNPIRTETVLKGQWLGQVISYLIYDRFDATGIVVFRSLILCLCLVVIYLRSRLLDLSAAISLLFVCLVGFNIFSFTGMRPQLFGFVFAGLMFFLIDRSEKQNNPCLLLLLPLLGLIWANTHGSFILAVVLLGIYCFGSFLQLKLKAEQPPINIKLLFAIFIVFLLFTFINPNGLTTYKYLFNLQNSDLQARTSEYISALRIYTFGHTLPQLWIYLHFTLTLLALPGLFKSSIAKAFIVIFLGAISIESFRYYAFFILISTPYIAQQLMLETQQRLPHLVNKLKQVAAPVFSVSLLIVTFALLSRFHSHSLKIDNINESRFPTAITDYLKNTETRGHVFNYLGWGGYLLWNLSPDVKPYIDGRMMDDAKLKSYTHILWATEEGVSLFEAEKFDYVIIPYISPKSGEIYSLNTHLLSHPNWRILYRGQQGYLYGRNN